MDWEQSEAAKAKGVCHTLEECEQMYNNIPYETKDKAFVLLRDCLRKQQDLIVEAIEENPTGWVHSENFGHLWWGMGLRNFLRTNGCGEEYFGVHNLDDIYCALVEEALTGKVYHYD